MKISALSFLAPLGLLVTVFADNIKFVNKFDARANMVCPENEYMYYIYSIHNNRREDRRWAFLCRSAGSTGNCEWTGYVNDFDGLLAYACPGNKVVTGINSYHNNRREDRRFKFQCCDVENTETNNCYYTGYVNKWDRPLTVNVSSDKAIKGASSYHSNRAEDRRWKFYVCELTPTTTTSSSTSQSTYDYYLLKKVMEYFEFWEGIVEE